MVRAKPASKYSGQSGTAGGYAQLKRKKEEAELGKRQAEMEVKDVKEEKKKLEEEVKRLKKEKEEVEAELKKEKEEHQKLKGVASLLSSAKRLQGDM
jgi:predicted  nucleic acid-binding Zn-ribbon protein